jgi:hypothetical protein
LHLKIAEIDNSVRVIDQQIRADAEVVRLNEELAADPNPVKESLTAAVDWARL